ncbi:MAG TPA: sulfotransferase [Actinomycetota bacterium]|jgi:hypothetical protein|nr:sulfotransferase [Actinomycetota bacterium]
MEPKIFGVGAHRTGSTSLMAALRVFGYRTSHWKDRAEIRADLESQRFRLSLMERVDAVSDLPIPTWYRQLAKAFPEAKFILTVRDTESWLRSVERHMANRMFEQEEKEFYGRSNFDREHFSDRFERHNGEVLQYFAGSSDLLVMDIVGGDGWEVLCPFLGVSVPGQRKFPWKSRGENCISE